MGFGSLTGGHGDTSTRGKIALYGDKELLWAFDQLPPRLQKKYARRGVTKAGRRIARAAKRHVPVRSGALKKSLAVKSRTYAKSGTVVAIIGPRTDHETTYQGKRHRPSKIAHLVEMGHGGPHAAEAKPFLRPAMYETANLCKSIIAAEIELGLQEMGRAFTSGTY